MERIMKWPELMLLIRHDVSTYNKLKELKAESSLYQEFVAEFKADSTSKKARELALKVKSEFSLKVGDADTPLLDEESERAKKVGKALKERYSDKLPHVIFVSPYRRTRYTLDGLMRGWPELSEVKIVEEERIREQEHGLALIYNDYKVFHTLHPEQKELSEIEGSYWYRYPQGENVPDVRERNRSWVNAVVRDFAQKRILVVTHHLCILSLMANFERWGAQKFIEVDKNDKPGNCSVTTYRGYPKLSTNGKFLLDKYNELLW